jgi:hypothetical protein
VVIGFSSDREGNPSIAHRMIAVTGLIPVFEIPVSLSVVGYIAALYAADSELGQLLCKLLPSLEWLATWIRRGPVGYSLTMHT